jgi:hypothetical protein
VFVTVEHYHPNQLFAGIARGSLHLEWSPARSFTRVGSTLECKY